VRALRRDGPLPGVVEVVSWDYFDSTCSVCWQTFTSTNSQREADQMRRDHDCPGPPNQPKAA
jgi:hypothetical protein